VKWNALGRECFELERSRTHLYITTARSLAVVSCCWHPEASHEGGGINRGSGETADREMSRRFTGSGHDGGFRRLGPEPILCGASWHGGSIVSPATRVHVAVSPRAAKRCPVLDRAIRALITDKPARPDMGIWAKPHFRSPRNKESLAENGFSFTLVIACRSRS